jgi:hypothetical protein
VQSKKMPPWFADGSYGHFLNDRSLSTQDIATLAAWADGGAVPGDPRDGPRPLAWPDGGWQIKPDLVVDGPKYDVPAKGIVEWTWIIVPGGFKEDTWVTSVEVKPSAPAVHAPRMPGLSAARRQDGLLHAERATGATRRRRQ